MIANLVYGTDIEKTQKFLRDYAKQNADNISQNRALETAETASFAANQTAEQEAARLRREAAREEAESELRRIQAGKEDIISRLAAGKASDAEKITNEGRVKLMRSSARSSEQDRLRQKQAALLADSSTGHRPHRPTKTVGGAATAGDTADTETQQPTFTIAGLKAAPAPAAPEKPYDPFGVEDPDARDYYNLQSTYPYPHLDAARQNVRIMAGGYDLDEYYRRALLEAFAGLGCFVEDEVRARDLESGEAVGRGGLSMSLGRKGEGVATAAAAGRALEAGHVGSGDDIF